MIGIHGIGGIGKTTLAKAVYNFIAGQFESCCFLENVRENSKKHGLEHLQKVVLSKFLGDKDIELQSVSERVQIIKHKLRQKKVLLLLDDVDEPEQLQTVVGGVDWFGSGSRVIITTRDRHLLEIHGIERKYEVHGLSDKDALLLLGWNAFKCENIDPSYKDILKHAITYACGLPLALEVIGSNLFNKSQKVWRSALYEYERIPHKKIQEILKISFDGLGEYQKKIFLDIACCFNGYRLEDVKHILDARHGISTEHSIDVLLQKSLLKINSYGCVTLHDLIRDMGREIVRQESPIHPGNRSRLWLTKDIVQVLEENSGSSKTEIVTLDAPEVEKVVLEWDGNAFKKMKNLKILIIKNVCFSQGAKHLPSSLIVLEWQNHPSNTLPVFHPKKPKFMNLKVLKLDRSDIEQIPDVSGVPNLKELSLEHCQSLIKVDESVGFLEKLRYLDVSGCSKLRTFPALRLPSLRALYFTGCSSLENFPDILGEMRKLTSVYVLRTSIKELPFSFKNLTNLLWLEIGNVHGMLRLPRSIATLPSLEEVDVSYSGGLQFLKQDVEEEEEGQSRSSEVSFRDCNILDESVAMVLSLFHNVVSLDLSGNNFTFLPESIRELWLLKELHLDNCKKLKEIRGIPPNMEYFFATNCMSLSPLSRSMLLDEELHNSGRKKFRLPGSSIPEWFDQHIIESNSISFWFRNKLPPFSLCVVTKPFANNNFRNISLNSTINGKNQYLQDCSYNSDVCIEQAEHIIIFDREISFEDKDKWLSRNEWNHVEYEVWSRSGTPFIENIGIHIHKQERNMEDIRFTDPLLQTSSSTRVQESDDDDYDDEKDDDNLDYGNLESHSMQSTSTSDTIRDRVGNCGEPSRKRKRSTSMLDLYNEASISEVDLDLDFGFTL